jgi:hypothetical protein
VSRIEKPEEVQKTLARQKAEAASRAESHCSAEELYIALREALKILKHYAGLLNMSDGGQRRTEVFSSPETWIARLREIGDLPKEKEMP